MMPRHKRRLRFEGLEPRNLLSADLANGVLSVVGTRRNDTIQVEIAQAGPQAGQLEVDVNGVQSFFDPNQVQAIRILGLAGNDQITIGDSVSIAAWISGGQGKDTIKGGSGDDTIHGNNGNDVLQGSAGNDKLYGDNGSDSLYGGDDDDYLDGGNGPDTCHGGEGDDRIKGGRGWDFLDGDDGDNMLDSDSGHDQLAHGVVVDLDREFKAALLGIGNASGKASYEIEIDGGQTHTQFELEVHHLAANTTFDVTIDRVTIGQFTTDGSGEGELQYFAAGSGNGAAFPLGFPRIHAGSRIRVGTSLLGTFVAKYDNGPFVMA